ncbi:uncharacterized protein LOC114329501 isoform X1 [Diabrotica virgifera virgifera]|uniref:Uncharacterized protein LOC114329501 isoform X1 n=1 Tax=Diabrotica virgifera virgifera TaxID=50390 RepID=A0A6P7FF75_DIAVI|nr:uncharacterized protein LOC114329501 isoform X1 [Diabrotica virgifera virgifera]
MMWPYVRWLVLLVSVLVLQSDWTTAAPNPNGDEMMRLLKLDQMYSSVARPSLRSGPVETEIRPKLVQRAMLRLQELDRLYSDRARPRFGKRTFHNNPKYAPLEYDSQYQQSEQDVGDWLPVRR